MTGRKNILIVDKDNVFLHALKKELAVYSSLYQVAFATHSAQAMTIMRKFAVHLMAANINLAGESGIDLLFWVRQSYPNIYVVLYTDSELTEEYKRTLLYGGAKAVLRKPFHGDDLVKVADKLYRKSESSILPDFVRLVDLLQMIASEQNLVHLSVTDHASHLAGTITVQNGYLLTAATTNGRTGMEALVQMLAWEDPSIMANKLPPQAGGQVSGMPLEQALLQAVVRLDETNT